MLWMFGQAIINGIFAGGVYSLIAVGITVIFGVMRMVNFAAGSYMMLGMYFTFLGYQLLGWENYLLIPFTIITSGIFAYVSYIAVIKHVIGKERTASIIATVGISYFIQNAVILIFGGLPNTLPSSIGKEVITIFSLSVALPRLISFIAALIMTVIISILIEKTMLGKCMRASSESLEISEMLGINTRKIFIIAWVLGIVLAGIAGALITPMYSVDPNIGTTFRSVGVIAVLLGGRGNIKGAFISGILLGIVEALVSIFVKSTLGAAGICVFFLLVMAVKPNGLFGKGERVA